MHLYVHSSVIYNSPGARNSLITHQKMSRSKNCGTFTQWNIMQPKERRTPILHNSMDKNRDYFAKLNRSVRVR